MCAFFLQRMEEFVGTSASDYRPNIQRSATDRNALRAAMGRRAAAVDVSELMPNIAPETHHLLQHAARALELHQPRATFRQKNEALQMATAALSSHESGIKCSLGSLVSIERKQQLNDVYPIQIGHQPPIRLVPRAYRNRQTFRTTQFQVW